MKITINERSCEANTGDKLLDAARKNHAHIGYFCGGNGICQTCYVKVLEGGELLSPLSEPEKAMLSDTLIREGTRMACLATIEKPGTIKILSSIEEVKQIYEQNPLQLTLYAAKMGWEALVKFPETVILQTERIINGKLDVWQLFTDIIGSIGEVVQVVVQSIQGDSAGEEKNALSENNITETPRTHNVAGLTLESCGCKSYGNRKTLPHTIKTHGAHNGVPA
ncbi:2Fe-2S iron-sulfur cluster-binding protein [Chlorobium phaeobacteroides]|jgi:chlorosome envelope protein X|nr:2Fe-2S iron-sulfur cluster-binding protein [Chlorobium phaeobacteroides]MBV5326164.1 (2Fe-2S)-binding protein [Chlorobium sp.]